MNLYIYLFYLYSTSTKTFDGIVFMYENSILLFVFLCYVSIYLCICLFLIITYSIIYYTVGYNILTKQVIKNTKKSNFNKIKIQNNITILFSFYYTFFILHHKNQTRTLFFIPRSPRTLQKYFF